jgi:uncharacterized protein YndB with AHSA1/START domain
MVKEKYQAVVDHAFASPVEKVWEAFATSEGFAKAYEGLKVECDWKVGGPIVWSGEWEGKKFRDEGTLKVYDRPRLFEYTYWTSFWGPTPDPDSIQTIRNEFIPVSGGTKLVITQTNIPNAESRDHSIANWKELLEKLEKTL